VVPGRHRAPSPTDPAYPDYPFFLDHDAEARARHVHAHGGRRWGRHPGFPAQDVAVHLPAPARRELQPAGAAGAAALTAAAGVTAAAWVVAVLAPPVEVVAFLSLSWLVGYLVAAMWLETVHVNAVALAPLRQTRRRTRASWLAWFVPVTSLWVPKRMVDDAMWTLARMALVHRLRWSGVWWTSFVLAVLLWAGAVTVAAVPAGRLPDVLGDVATLDAGLRVGAAVACTLALVLWAPIVRRLSMISDQLADLKRSTLVR
jgi:hypothetical protein